MGKILNQWLKQSAPMEPGLEAMLNLFVSAKIVEADMEAMLAEFGITRRQYNVLRILRGVHPGGHPRTEIAKRVIEQAPDITRIMDRLQEQGMITRSRGKKDRRESLSMITTKGLAIVEKAAPYVELFARALEKKLTPKGCQELSQLCEKLYKEKLDQSM